MAAHPLELRAGPFTEADQVRLVGFSCGEEPWSRHVAEWILGSDVFDSMKRGTRVWLFETADGEVVGFGSLGTSKWRWPPPIGERATIALIPMLGIAEQFRGQPTDPEWRYSRQILGHLIAEATRLTRAEPEEGAQVPQWFALLVHRDNARAIQFYQHCGFELIAGVERNKGHVVMKVGIGE